MDLSLHHDSPPSDPFFQSFLRNDVLARLKALDARAERKGLGSLDPKRNPLIPIGTEIDGKGRVTKNSYGVFHLSWRAQQHREWPAMIQAEIHAIRDRIRAAHKTRLRFLIWAGMGGSAEDKSMYQAVGLLARGPRCYVLDSTDPAKLKAILADIQKRSGASLKESLKGTLVVGMAMGMTSYEPAVNLEKLHAFYERSRIDSRPNFLYMTLPGSLLDRFAGPRGYRRVELQPDNGNSTAGRHSGPLTRGSLYPLALAGVNLEEWIGGTFLTRDQIHNAWKLSAFLHAQGIEGRDKVTLLLPKQWEGAALWTKQDFEESLGKCERSGIKIAIGETPRLANYRSPKEPYQDRLFLAVQRRGAPGPDRAKLSLMKRLGYPLAVLTLPANIPLSGYMQFIHYTVFGLGYLRNMNFVTQPGVELYKSIAGRIAAEAAQAGGIEKSREWQRFLSPATTLRCGGGVSLHFPFLPQPGSLSGGAAEVYAKLLAFSAGKRDVECAELTYFGDTRYSPAGRKLLGVLHRAGELVFRSRLKMPVDVYEGPAMNHSYHEMIIGHGRCFTTVLLAGNSESIPAVNYTADYHKAQFLATQSALAERGRSVVALLLRDLEEPTLAALGGFFREVASHLKSARVRS